MLVVVGTVPRAGVGVALAYIRNMRDRGRRLKGRPALGKRCLGTAMCVFTRGKCYTTSTVCRICNRIQGVYREVCIFTLGSQEVCT